MAKKLSDARAFSGYTEAYNGDASFAMVMGGENRKLGAKQLLATIRGEVQPGRDGIDGKDGEPGAPGAPGRDGADGRDGIDGRDGEPGAPGAPGRDGADGRDGVDGADGAPGSITNETYSTTEVDTGKTWINGKKIYRRVWQGTTSDVSAGTDPIGYSTWVMPDVIMFENIIHSHLQLNYGPKGSQPSARYVGGSMGTNNGYTAPWAFELTSRTLYINFQNIEMRKRVSLAPITLILEYTKQ